MAPRKLQAIRGMDDVLPEGAASFIYRSEVWNAVTRAYADYAEARGYGCIQTPVLEATELFARTSGETSDIVSKEMYTFETRGGDSVSMRPEGSASVCRAVIQHGLLQGAGPLKLYYIAPMFRAERPQKGRYRQHTQLGLEVFREEDPTVDAEVIAFLHGFYRSLGLDQLTVWLNSVGSPACRPAYREKLVAYLEQYRGDLSEDSQRRLETNPMRVLDSKDPKDAEIVRDAPVMLDHLDDESAAHFDGVRAALDVLSVPYTIQPRLVRGLDYYTRTAFEVTCESLDGAIRVIGGGGRYDGLIEQIGGQPTPGVGFGCGVERLLLALESQSITPAEPPSPFASVVYLAPEDKLSALALAEELRAAGVRTDFAYKSRGFGKLMAQAVKSGARFCVIVGGEEAQRGEVSLKDLVTRDQRPVKRENLVKTLRAAPDANAPML